MSEVDYKLRSQVDALQGQVVRLEQGVGQVGVQVAHVGQRTEETNDRLVKLSQRFEQYVIKAERTANVQRSETRIGVVEAQIEHKYGHYNVVRRVARGILEGFDNGLLSDDRVRDIGEELVMSTPGYWLAPILVALRAW